MNFSFETMTQMKYVEKKYKVDYFTIDGSGCNALHYLCRNKLEDVFKLGLKHLKDSDSAKGKTKKSNIKYSEVESDEEEHSEPEDDHENNLYFDSKNMKHIKANEIGWNIYQDAFIQVAQYLLKKDKNKELKNTKSQSYLKMAIQSGNYKLACWLVENKLSKLCLEDLQSYERDSRYDSDSFLHDLISEENCYENHKQLLSMLKYMNKGELKQLFTVKNEGKNIFIKIIELFKEYYENNRGDETYNFLKNDLLKTFKNLVSIATYCGYPVSEKIILDQDYDFPQKFNYNIFNKPCSRHLGTFKNSFGIINLNKKKSDMIFDHPYDNENYRISSYKKKSLKSNMLHLASKSHKNNDENNDYDDYDDY